MSLKQTFLIERDNLISLVKVVALLSQSSRISPRARKTASILRLPTCLPQESLSD